VTFTQWLRVGWLILVADFLYWISGVAYKGEGHPPSDWHATFNTVTFFGGWILFGLLLLGEFIVWFSAWAAKQREF
jgi:hypothetical protein